MNDRVEFPQKAERFGELDTVRRLAAAGDAEPILAFTGSLAPHDLLFVNRDVSNDRVVKAWLEGSEAGDNITLLISDADGRVLGTASIFRDPLSWSAHVGDIRVMVHPDARGVGVGRALVQDCFKLALQAGITRMTAQMTVDQKGAITIFEELGFRGAALLKDHVMDREGTMHDIVILACNVEDVYTSRALVGDP